jgi:polyisoprenoid-binding protein YceI
MAFGRFQDSSGAPSGLSRPESPTVQPFDHPTNQESAMRHLVIAAALFVAGSCAHATTYTIEARHTQGVVRWNHLGFANPSAQINGIEGTLVYDPAEPSKASVVATIPVARMATGVPDLDDDFRSAAFFDFEKFPTASFKSTHVAKGKAPDHLTITGDFMVHGMSRPLTLDVVVNKVGTNPRNQLATVGFEAHATLQRSDFGLGRFVPQVSDAVRVELTVEAAEAEGYAKILKQEAAEAAEEAAKAAQKGGN